MFRAGDLAPKDVACQRLLAKCELGIKRDKAKQKKMAGKMFG